MFSGTRRCKHPRNASFMQRAPPILVLRVHPETATDILDGDETGKVFYVVQPSRTIGGPYLLSNVSQRRR